MYVYIYINYIVLMTFSVSCIVSGNAYKTGSLLWNLSGWSLQRLELAAHVNGVRRTVTVGNLPLGLHQRSARSVSEGFLFLWLCCTVCWRSRLWPLQFCLRWLSAAVFFTGLGRGSLVAWNEDGQGCVLQKKHCRSGEAHAEKRFDFAGAAMFGGQDPIAAERAVAEAQPRGCRFTCPPTPGGRTRHAHAAVRCTFEWGVASWCLGCMRCTFSPCLENHPVC